MKHRSMSLVASVMMILGFLFATAPAANAHASICRTALIAPIRQAANQNRIAANATTKMPRVAQEPPHQRRCGLTATIQVWAPNGYGGGRWRDLGLADADWTSGRRRATAYPTSSLLFGTNYYRNHVEFWADGPAGTIERVRNSAPIKYTRYFPRRR